MADSSRPAPGTEGPFGRGGQALLELPGMLSAGAGVIRQGLGGMLGNAFSADNLVRMAEEATMAQQGLRPSGEPMLGTERLLYLSDAAVPGPAPIGSLGSGPRFTFDFLKNLRQGRSPTARYRDVTIRGIPAPTPSGDLVQFSTPGGPTRIMQGPQPAGSAGATERAPVVLADNRLAFSGSPPTFKNDEMISMQAGLEQGAHERRLAHQADLDMLAPLDEDAHHLIPTGYAAAGVEPLSVGPGGLSLEEIMQVSQRLTPRRWQTGVMGLEDVSGTRGFFQPSVREAGVAGQGGFVGINPDLLNDIYEQSPELARRVAAHELGHQLMFLKDKQGTLSWYRANAPELLPPEDVFRATAEITAASIKHARPDSWRQAFADDPLADNLLAAWSDPTRLTRSLESGASIEETSRTVGGYAGEYLSHESERLADALSIAITNPRLARQEMPTFVRFLQRISETDEVLNQNLLFSSPSTAPIGLALEALDLGPEQSGEDELRDDRPR